MEEKLFNCPVEASLSVVGGKYKSIILYHLMTDGTLRFNEIQKLIPQATIKMLSQQLKDLEAEGIIHKEIYPVVPPKTGHRDRTPHQLHRGFLRGWKESLARSSSMRPQS